MRATLRAAVTLTSMTLAAGGALLASAPPASAGSTTTVPYTDERSTGTLTLCDAAGHELTHGSTATQPLLHLAVGQSPAPAGYGEGRGTATLYGYQPRPGLAPGEWSGELLTGASRFPASSRPAAAALPEDASLAGFVADFPPTWGGIVQLRLVLGAPGRPALSGGYDTADLKVTGGSWTLVRGGGGRCGGARAVPVAQLLGVQATASRSAAAVPRGVITRRPVTESEARQDGTSTIGTRLQSDSSADWGQGLGLLLAAGLLLTVGGLFGRRRRANSRNAP